MTKNDVIAAAGSVFETRFGSAPDAVAYAPGRVNLLGEHTDYNGGLVLPMPLALGTAVAVSYSDDAGRMQAASSAFDGIETRALNEKATGAWSDYVLGSVLAAGFDTARGLQVAVDTDLPVGSGLSSSAAIEVGTMRAVLALMNKTMDAQDMAIKARGVENNFVGLPSGIMDQFCVAVGAPGAALFLDTRTLEYREADLPDGFNFVIVHSGVGHKLTDNGYATRVKECADACAALGVEMLSDLAEADLDRISALPAPLSGRARHIVTENARVKAGVNALAAGDSTRFGALMVESHASQRDDYNVSVPQIDKLVDGAIAAGALGARLTGGGFGGSIVALVESAKVTEWCDKVSAGFPDARVLAVT